MAKPRKRITLSQKTRFEVFKRDRFACQYCGRTPPAVMLQVDHILAVAAGGSDDPTNLITACEECNQGKGDRSLDQVPSALKDQFAKRLELAEQVEAYNAFLMAERDRIDGQVKNLGRYWYDKFMPERDRWVFGASRRPTIKTFLESLASAEIMEAMDIACGRVCPAQDDDERTWKYFCGVCWRKIRRSRGEDVRRGYRPYRP